MKKTDKNCKYLNLYIEDFVSLDIWKQICDSVGVNYNTKEISIFYDYKMTEYIGE